MNDYDVHQYSNKQFIEAAQTHFDKDSTFYVFSDKIDEAKKILPEDRKYVFIDNNKNYVDLFLMTKFSKHIVSPSTFGWWGAWLSKTSEKVVIAKDWFNKDKVKAYLNNNDIIPANWIKI